MSCGVGCRCSLDTALLWLWCRPAATAPIRPLAWEPPYAVGTALEKAKRQKKKKKKKKKKESHDLGRSNLRGNYNYYCKDLRGWLMSRKLKQTNKLLYQKPREKEFLGIKGKRLQR